MMKTRLLRHIIILLISLPVLLSAKQHYCSPSSGMTEGYGTVEHPWQGLNQALQNTLFLDGDTLILLPGHYPEINLRGKRQTYSYIIGTGQVTMKKLVIGKGESCQNWQLENIAIQAIDTAIYITKNASNIRLSHMTISGDINSSYGMVLEGMNTVVQHSTIQKVKLGICSGGLMQTLINNCITDFSQTGIEVSSPHSQISHNLIKEYHHNDTDQGIAIHITKSLKNTHFNGNTILNFTKKNRPNTGQLIGIKAITKLSNCSFSNNLIVSNHREGLSLPLVTNTKIVNNTLANPYFGIALVDEENINNSIIVGSKSTEASTNIIVQNNIANHFNFANASGLANHNHTLSNVVAEYDEIFNDWASFDFSLAPNSIAINAGTSQSITTYDINSIARQKGHFVNLGAYESGKMDERAQKLSIIAHIADRELWSNGKMDWDGQSILRVGGSGEAYDGLAVFPFLLPTINGGKQILNADFSVILNKTDNKPNGNIDAYGLLPKSHPTVDSSHFYQGTYGQDFNARPLQKQFITAETLPSTCTLSPNGQAALSAFLNSIYETQTQQGQYAFIRLSPDNNDILDYHRWILLSANSKKEKQKPKLHLEIGYAQLQNNESELFSNENELIASANLLERGKINIHCYNPTSNKAQLKLFSNKTKILDLELILENNINFYTSVNTEPLPAGLYKIQLTCSGLTQEQTLYIW